MATDQDLIRELTEASSEERVVVITQLVPNVILKEQMRDGSGRTVAYSNHEAGFAEVDMTFTPIKYVVGDAESEERAIDAMVDLLRPVSVAVLRGFQEQVERIKAMGGQPPSRM